MKANSDNPNIKLRNKRFWKIGALNLSVLPFILLLVLSGSFALAETANGAPTGVACGDDKPGKGTFSNQPAYILPRKSTSGEPFLPDVKDTVNLCAGRVIKPYPSYRTAADATSECKECCKYSLRSSYYHYLDRAKNYYTDANDYTNKRVAAERAMEERITNCSNMCTHEIKEDKTSDDEKSHGCFIHKSTFGIPRRNRFICLSNECSFVPSVTPDGKKCFDVNQDDKCPYKPLATNGIPADVPTAQTVAISAPRKQPSPVPNNSFGGGPRPLEQLRCCYNVGVPVNEAAQSKKTANYVGCLSAEDCHRVTYKSDVTNRPQRVWLQNLECPGSSPNVAEQAKTICNTSDKLKEAVNSTE